MTAPVDVIHDRYHLSLPDRQQGKAGASESAPGRRGLLPGLPPGTRSELESVRRALRNLRMQGPLSLRSGILRASITHVRATASKGW